jgi:acyl-CoA reductase LuxC
VAVTNQEAAALPVRHIVRGNVIDGPGAQVPGPALRPLSVPPVDVDSLVWPRSRPGPAFHLPVEEAIDLLVALGRELRLERNEYLQEVVELLPQVNPFSKTMVAGYLELLPQYFARATLESEVRYAIGAADTWQSFDPPDGAPFAVRACPARLLHVIAGNGPGNAAMAIVRGSLTRGVNLIKLPSNDPFTAVAILQTMKRMAPGHPLTDSFTAAFWRGGDESVEPFLFRSQYFDKIVAWGGEGAIRNAARYLGPGLELISFDPKSSISMIGREAHADGVRDEVARLAADDVSNQLGCTNSRVQFVEGSVSEVDEYCDALIAALRKPRPNVDPAGNPTPMEIWQEAEVLSQMEPLYRVWGRRDGTGLVIRSEEPVEFELTARTVNVVPVADLPQAVRWINLATQTIGVYPSGRKTEMRDLLAAAGAQRLVPLGGASMVDAGNLGRPHDGMWPLHRMSRWVLDEGSRS